MQKYANYITSSYNLCVDSIFYKPLPVQYPVDALWLLHCSSRCFNPYISIMNVHLHVFYGNDFSIVLFLCLAEVGVFQLTFSFFGNAIEVNDYCWFSKWQLFCFLNFSFPERVFCVQILYVFSTLHSALHLVGRLQKVRIVKG